MSSHVKFDELAEYDPSHYRFFDKLRKQPGARCVEDVLDLSSATAHGPILWLQGAACRHLQASFVVCERPADAFLLLDQLPPNARGVYEVVMASAPQRLWIDWELYEADLPDCDPEQRKRTNDDFEMLLDVAVHGVTKPTSPSDIVIACSSGMTADRGYKYSFHVYVATQLYPNTATVKAVVQDVAERFDVASRLTKNCTKPNKGFDMSVYKATSQNFRLVGAEKNGRRLDLTAASVALGAIPQYTLIQPPADHVLDVLQARTPRAEGRDIFAADLPPPTFALALTETEVERAVELASKRLGDAFAFAGGRGRFLAFKRLLPTMCEVACGRQHDRDNMYVHVEENGTVVLKCRRDPTQGVKLGRTMPALAQRLARANMKRDEAHPIIAELCKTANSSAICRELPSFAALLEEHDTCCIRAPMGIGKTNELLNVLRETPGMSVAILSFRQSFTAEIDRRFSDFDFHVYRDSKGLIYLNRTPHVIVQMESLWRLQGMPDLLVLDESESLIEQFMSPTMNTRRRDCFRRYAALLRGAKRIVAMDATMTERTLTELQRYRPHVHMAVTTRQLHRDKACIVTAKPLAWEAELLMVIDAGKNIAIASSSAHEVKVLADMIAKTRPNVAVQSYTAKTEKEVKERCFADVNAEWSKYQVVIYSPTVLAGISFEREHFHQVFGYFHNTSVTVQGAIQMLGRVRNVTDKRIVLCIKDRPLPGAQTVAAVEEYVQSYTTA